MGSSHISFTRMAGERDLLFVGEVLVAKDQHGIFIHAGFDRIDLPWSKRFLAIDTRNLSGKDPVDSGLRQEGNGFVWQKNLFA